jgi:heat shock protein HslJ
MKKLILFTVLSMFVDCKSKSNEPLVISKKEVLERNWMLIEFQDFDKQYLSKNKAQLNLSDSNSLNASMGCNGIGFKMKYKENTIHFSDLIATEMHCGDNMKLENAFLTTLPTINQYKIDGHKLILTNSKNEKMVFIAQDWD